MAGFVVSSDDLAKLDTALRTTLAPFDLASLDQWRDAVNRQLRALLRADAASFMLPECGGPLLRSDGLDSAVLAAYAERYGALDTGLRVRRRQLGLEVWTRAMLWTRAETRRSEYFADFVTPHRLHDAVGISFDLPGGAFAGVSFHHRSRGGTRFGARGLAILRLLRPAIKTAVAMHRMFVRRRGDLSCALDTLTEGVLLADLRGQVLHVNPSLGRILSADPERERVRRAIEQVRRSVGWRMRRLAVPAGLAEGPLATVVRTAATSYHVRGVYLGPTALPPHQVVLVVAERLTPEPPSREMLTRRYSLTSREAEIAIAVAEGKSNAEIATALVISPHTARHHVERVLAKLGVHSRAAVGPALQR
jgi:DNA-binding CsgD family transcriptional regulator/PAS domain-containing protein